MRRWALAVAVLALSGGFYMILIDTASAPELYTMAGVLLLALLAFEVSRRQGLTQLKFDLRWLSSLWRPLIRAPWHVVLVSFEAVAQLGQRKRARGQFRAVAFEGGQGPEDIGRHALTEALGSFTPNTIVIGVDADSGLLLVHQLRHEGGREKLDVLRLGAR